MNVYRWVWRTAWLVIGVVPVGVGILAAPVAVFCLGSSVAVVVAATGRARSTWIASGLLGGAAVAGLWSAGAAGFGLLVMACATAPSVVARVGRSARRSRREASPLRTKVGEVCAAPVLSADLLAGPVHALEDQQLFLSWSDSFMSLKQARTTDQRLELVNLRQAYLDELESRNAAGFDAWLRSGAGPIGNPQSFFVIRGAGLGTPSGCADPQPD